MAYDDQALLSHLTQLPLHTARPALSTAVIPTLTRSIASIARTLRSAPPVSALGSSNAFGDEQLNVDVLAEDIIRADIRSCPAILTASSEEDPIEKPANPDHVNPDSKKGEVYTIAFDPLDGSSIIAPNWTVGTIIGVWDGPTALGSDPEDKLVAAILGVYGPRTTMIVALRVPGTAPTCFEVGFSETSTGSTTCQIVRQDIKLLSAPFKTRYFAPANLRAAAEDEAYAALVTRFIQEKYTLRYSGGLVPDVVHALVKGHGVYVSPVTEKSKAKLRRLYELTAVALVLECAGGMAVDAGTGERVLGARVEDCDERGGLICGTMEEVERVKEALGLRR